MQRLEKKLGIHDPDWMMSCREKLCLIAMLELMQPKRVIEFGYCKGGATKWLSKYSQSVLTVDVNDHVPIACKRFSNVEAWQMSTEEALAKIKLNSMKFDLGIIDADHSRKGVRRDLKGLNECCSLILLHDSYNPTCRKGMKEAARLSNCAYTFDLISPSLKIDGLWGGFGIVMPGEKEGRMEEYEKEITPFKFLYICSILRISGLNSMFCKKINYFSTRILNHIKIIGGGIKQKIRTIRFK